MSQFTHMPVLLREAVQALDVSDSHIIVDATYGRGGHTSEIVKQMSEDARLLVMDRDQVAIEHALKKWADEKRLEVVHASFSHLSEQLQNRDLIGKVDAILFDFGVSSPQLDDAQRGFSFSNDGPLDMRMDSTQGISAANWIQQVSEEELISVLKRYGEERYARRIARKIKETLLETEIRSTAQLSELVCQAIPRKEKGKHPATRTFQAIRIAVNQELQEIEQVLPQAMDALAPGGRLVMISFHSLEDRLVKQFFKQQSKGDPYPPDFPVTQDMLRPNLKLESKAIKPDEQQIKLNPRCRSAVMRVATKIDQSGRGELH